MRNKRVVVEPMITILHYDFVIRLPSTQNSFQFIRCLKDQSGSYLLLNSFDALIGVEQIKLCHDSLKLMCSPNAGGTSVHSEVLSFEFLKRR